ncbi:MAG: beta-galactosidase trimerization domain-containing protein, partial [Planctomycetota bacterium]
MPTMEYQVLFSYYSNYYGGGELPVIHDSLSPDTRKAEWTGYGKIAGSDARRGEWQRFLYTRGGMSYYEQINMLNPDYRPTIAAIDFHKVNKDMRTGLTKMLLKSKLEHDRIAIYYSMPSIIGSTISGFGAHKYTRYGWLWSVLDSGFQPHYISYLEVREKGISNKDFDVVILPRVLALSEKEASAIKRFVKQGGTVLTDSVPGVLSGHCRILENGSLDKLFGITHVDPFQKEKPKGDLVVGGTIDGLSLGKWSEGSTLDTSGVKLSGGKALGAIGETPAFIINKYGKGKTLYMNIPMEKYLALREGNNEKKFKDQFNSILKWSNVKSQIDVKTTDKKKVEKLTMYRHSFNGGQLV